MSAVVSEFLGNNIPFTCNALEQEKKANAGSKPQLAIIVLVHLKCRAKHKIINVTDTCYLQRPKDAMKQ
jgi:hypothetical protein